MEKILKRVVIPVQIALCENVSKKTGNTYNYLTFSYPNGFLEKKFMKDNDDFIFGQLFKWAEENK